MNDNDPRERAAAHANLTQLGAIGLTPDSVAVTAAVHLFTALGCVVAGMPNAAAGAASAGLMALERWAAGETSEGIPGDDNTGDAA